MNRWTGATASELLAKTIRSYHGMRRTWRGQLNRSTVVVQFDVFYSHRGFSPAYPAP